METCIVVTVLFVVTAVAILAEHKKAMAEIRRRFSEPGSCDLAAEPDAGSWGVYQHIKTRHSTALERGKC